MGTGLFTQADPLSGLSLLTAGARLYMYCQWWLLAGGQETNEKISEISAPQKYAPADSGLTTSLLPIKISSILDLNRVPLK